MQNETTVMLLDGIYKTYGIRLYSYQENWDMVQGLGLEGAAAHSNGVAFYYEGTPCIIYNSDQPMIQALFTVAHELGHIMLGHVSFRRDFDRKHTDCAEREADAFAVQLLARELARHYEARA